MGVGESVVGVGEDPPELPEELGLTGGGVEAGDDAVGDEPGELDGIGIGGTEVDGDASLVIVNSGLALPESPNTVMSNEHDASCGSVEATYGQQYSLSRWEH